MFCQPLLFLAPWQQLNMILASHQTAQLKTVDEVDISLDLIEEDDAGPHLIDEAEELVFDRT